MRNVVPDLFCGHHIWLDPQKWSMARLGHIRYTSPFRVCHVSLAAAAGVARHLRCQGGDQRSGKESNKLVTPLKAFYF